MVNTAISEVESTASSSWLGGAGEDESTEAKPSFIADRQRGFANAAHELLDASMIRCEERYPKNGSFSVLYLVVDKNVSQWREKLDSLRTEYFGPEQDDPLSPVRLEVVDRITDEALQRLVDLGLVCRSTRAARPLWPDISGESRPQRLSEVEREKVRALRLLAARKLKIARLLGEGELCEEARSALLEAMLPLGRALAIEGRLPEPADLNEVFLPPLAHRWREALIPLRLFTSETAAPWKPALDCLSTV
jgi:hypothetical protein